MATPELTTLGRYRIERVLGKGAMGVVYEGFDPRLNRRVAIKTILKSHLDDHTARDYSVRFEREAQAVARLNHPNIVQVHDFGEEGEVAYLVMEFIKGRELKSFFDANERFDLKEAVRIMGELCEALEFAHKAGIVHRDVKPGNVMLDSEMRAKLTDFGVARVQDSGASRATQTGAMVGTPAYMSPEQITGRPVDARSDVFSAGIILYQFLTGEMPFAGAGAWTIAKKIMQDEPALPSTIDTAISPMFDAVVAKALAKQPEQRYQSARALGTALKRALEGKGEDGDADRTVVRVPGKPAAGTAAPSGIQAPHDDATAPLGTAAKARPALFKSLLIGAALAATGAVAWFAWKQMQVDSPGRTFRDCDVCPEIGAIAARSFTMGSPESKPGWYAPLPPASTKSPSTNGTPACARTVAATTRAITAGDAGSGL
jgi:serine/threonine protein kinase